MAIKSGRADARGHVGGTCRRHTADKTVGQPGGRMGPPRAGPPVTHRADVHITDAHGGHTHSGPSLSSSLPLSFSVISLAASGQASDRATASPVCRGTERSSQPAFSGSWITAASASASPPCGRSGALPARPRADWRGQAASTEVSRAAAQPAGVPSPAASAAGKVARRLSSLGSITHALAASRARAAAGGGPVPRSSAATAGPPDRFALRQSMSQELNGVRVQLPLDQQVKVLPRGHAVGQQAPRLIAQAGARELRGPPSR